MILVDTSIWVEFFNDPQSPPGNRLQRLIEEEQDLCLADIVLIEILQGFRADEAFEQAKELLSQTSLQEVLKKTERIDETGGDVMHLASGKKGEFLAKSSDGRVLAKFEDKEVFLWPFEVKFLRNAE